MFHLIAEAYDVLVDPQKRQNYDEFGTVGYTFGGQANGPSRPKDHTTETPEEIFQKIFGASKAPEMDDHKGHDFADSFGGFESTREYLASMSFEEAARGTDYSMGLCLRIICPKCKGDQAELGYTWNVCMFCEGTGTETEKMGHVLTRRTCTYCNGTKKYFKHKCMECEGTGQVIRNFNYKIPIPPGTEDGQVLKYHINPELLKITIDHDPYFYVYVTVEPQSCFKREDLDIVSEADISITQAILGGTTEIRGLHKEELDVTIPPLTSSHKQITIFDEGIMRSDRSLKGHHHVKIGILSPKRLTPDMKRIWLKFASLEALEDGVVNGVEHELDHKYKTAVVDPSEVKRTFNVRVKTSKERYLAQQREASWRDKIREYLEGAP